MISGFRLTLWMAFADFFSALTLLVFALFIVTQPKPMPPVPKPIIDQIEIDREVKALANAMRDALAKQGVKVPPVSDSVSIVLPELLLFKSGEFAIRDRAKAELVVEALKLVRARWRGSFLLVIQGHTDARPPRANPEYRDNLELSKLRAGAVERFMTEAGIAPPMFQIASQGVGAVQPVVPNCRSDAKATDCAGPDDFRTADELAANRRIELRFGVFSGNTR